MAVRVKLRITSVSGKEAITSALVNSGFEAETPQLLIPKSLARELGLWPPPLEAVLVEVGTAGAVSVFIIICSARVHWFLRPLNGIIYKSGKPVHLLVTPGFRDPQGGELLGD